MKRYDVIGMTNTSTSRIHKFLGLSLSLEGEDKFTCHNGCYSKHLIVMFDSMNQMIRLVFFLIYKKGRKSRLLFLFRFFVFVFVFMLGFFI